MPKGTPGNNIPSVRVQKAINTKQHHITNWERFASEVGVSSRTIRRIRTLQHATVDLYTAERILVGLDMQLWEIE